MTAATRKASERLSGAGWYVVETDSEGSQTLAHWVCYPAEKDCIEGIRNLNMPKWTGALSARLHDGSVWK